MKNKKIKFDQKISTKLGTIVFVIFAITAGMFIWIVEKNQRVAEKPVISQMSRAGSPDSKDSFDNFSISSFDKWKNYRDNKNKIEFKYPPELPLSTTRGDIILSISTISPDIKIPDVQIMNQLIVYANQKNIGDIIDKKKSDNPRDFTQKTIKINGVPAEQISYRGAYAGELWIDTLIKNGSGTIVISYPGDNQKNKDIFDRIISTFHIIQMEEVSFCGKTYNSDQIILNNIDVAKTIAKISERESWICKNLELGKFQESGIGIAQKKDESEKDSYLIVLFNSGDTKEESDPFNQSPDIFRFDFSNNKIFYQSQFDGSFKLLGAIK